MWRCLSVVLISAIPSSVFSPNPSLAGLQSESSGAATFGATLVPCTGPLGDAVHLFVGDQGGTQEAVEEVGGILMELPSRELIRRVLMPGERRATLRLRPVLDLDGDGWSDVGELQGVKTGAACNRSAIIRSGRTGVALWSASRFAEKGERGGRESLFRSWLHSGLEDLSFLPDIDGDGKSDLVVVGESLAVWSGADAKALWVRDAKDLPQGNDKNLALLPDAGTGGRLAVGGRGGELHIFSSDSGEVLWKHSSLREDAAYHSFAVSMPEGSPVETAADLDGDGEPDDVVCFWLGGSEDTHGGEVSAFSSATGERLWSVRGDAENEPGFGSSAAAIGDMNGDGLCDYAVGAGATGTVTLLSGSGGGVLWKRKRAPGFGANLAALPDLDGDGVLDLVAGLPPVPKSPGGAVVILKGSNGRQWLRVEPPE